MEDQDSEEDEGTVRRKEGEVPVGGIKAPATMNKKVLLKLVPKLELQIVKLKDTIKKIETCKSWCWRV